MFSVAEMDRPTILAVNPCDWDEQVEEHHPGHLSLAHRLIGEQLFFNENGHPITGPGSSWRTVGHLNEFIEMNTAFDQLVSFERRLHISGEMFRQMVGGGSGHFMEIFEREIWNIFHQIEKNSCPDLHVELRGSSRPSVVQEHQFSDTNVDCGIGTLFRGKMKSNLNIDTISVGVLIPESLHEETPSNDICASSFASFEGTSITGLFYNYGMTGALASGTDCSGYGTSDTWPASYSTGVTFTVSGTAGSCSSFFDRGIPVSMDEMGNYRIGEYQEIDAITLMKEAIKKNSKIVVARSRSSLKRAVPQNEMKARDTLHDMLSESDWRRYVANGFIMVKAQSGKWYQIFNDRKRLKVYEKGVLVEEICIHSDDSCPPTDHVINMKVMVEIDEESLRKGGNISASVNPLVIAYGAERKPSNLVDLFNRLKAS